MRDIVVKKEDLLNKVRVNRDAHRDIFLRAQEKYREAIIAELDRMLEDARSGRKISRFISLPEPEDHTEDYDRAIGMLEMELRGEIELTETDFAIYVLDQWAWRKAWASSTASYLSLSGK